MPLYFLGFKLSCVPLPSALVSKGGKVMMDKTPEQLALEYAEILVPYRPWVDQYLYAEDAKFRKIVEQSYLTGYKEAKKAAWILMKERRKQKL